MKFKTWLESIESNVDPIYWEMLLREAPHTRFTGAIPPEFSFLKGQFIDLGFENMGQSPGANALLRAFGGSGLRIPHTPYKIRYTNSYSSVVELTDPSENLLSLPDDWEKSVIVIGNDDRFSWVGHNVRKDQLGGDDLNGYEDVGKGRVPV